MSITKDMVAYDADEYIVLARHGDEWRAVLQNGQTQQGVVNAVKGWLHRALPVKIGWREIGDPWPCR